MIEEVLTFWFEQNGPAQWWTRDPQFDAAIRSRFGALHDQAVLGELHDWRDTPEGRLAEIIVLDQFSRNLYRDATRAPSRLTRRPWRWRRRQYGPAPIKPCRQSGGKFVYMPYQHSESQRNPREVAVALFESLGDPEFLDYERRHKAIVDSLRALSAPQPHPGSAVDAGGGRVPSGTRFVVFDGWAACNVLTRLMLHDVVRHFLDHRRAVVVPTLPLRVGAWWNGAPLCARV